MNNANVRSTTLFLAELMLVSVLLVSCYDAKVNQEDDTTRSDSDTAAKNSDEDDLPVLDYGKEVFTMLTFEEPYADMIHVFDEPSDDAIDNAKYKMITAVEERLKIDIVETVQSEAYVNSEYRAMINAGADEFDIVFANDRFAHYFAEEGAVYDYNDLIYIDLSKDYWDQSLLGYTTVGNSVYYAYGTYDFTYFDLTHCLVFNKELLRQLNISDNPYELVESGQWTMDKMYEMAEIATFENNGDDVWTTSDNYGLISSGKQILPNFWIAGGTTTVSLDRKNMPYLTMGDNEQLINVINKCYEMFWDGGVWFVSTSAGNQSDHHAEMFLSGRALFADYTFFFTSQLRDCEYDFGILPYPKFDASQKEYFSRVEAGTTMVTVPITNPDPDRASAVIEAMASEGYKTILPEYYEHMLKRRNSRDEESFAMLDLIFDTRVYDLGDTWYCDQIRDGMMATMWNSGKNNFSSTYKAYEKMLKKTLSETIAAYMK